MPYIPLVNSSDTLNKLILEFGIILRKEEIINRAMDNIRGLHKLKEKGSKVGKLKFKSFIYPFI